VCVFHTTTGNELAQTALIKIAEFENEIGDHRPGHPG
jgi:hypothetical protein